MKNTPPLDEGEEIVHHHTPSLRAFKRTALLMLAITLIPTALILYLFPDTLWGAVPLFITALLLTQERVTLGKYAAWVTNKRVLLQGGEALALGDIEAVDAIGNAVRLRGAGQRIKLYYPDDRAALVALLQTRTEAR